MLEGEGLATVRKIHSMHVGRNPLDVQVSISCLLRILWVPA
jgi:hypothetical protein